MTTIKLGDIARDTITGFEGVAIARSTALNNCPRWTLQPQEVKDGVATESRSFDEPNVEFVRGTDIPTIACVRPEEPAELGDTVRDLVTGLEGVVMSITIFQAGCTRIAVQPRALKDGLPVSASYCDECHLAVIKRASPKPAPVNTGGPRMEPRR
jgi:hypothetical protein